MKKQTNTFVMTATYLSVVMLAAAIAMLAQAASLPWP